MPHPGQLLADELRIRNMSASELARRIGVPTNRVTKILNGQLAVTADTALRLAHFFGTGADFWLNLQSLNDLRVAEAKSGKMIHRLPTLKLVDRRQPLSGPRGAAGRLGLNRSTLQFRMKKLGIEKPSIGD